MTKLLPYTKPMQDGRRKIHPDDHKQIRRDYKELKSLQKTANLWNVSKRLILIIVNPESRKRLRDHQIKAQYWKKYYDKNRHKFYMRKHRAKKRREGLIVSKKK